MPKINSLEVVHQDTNKDSYQNLHDILVELNKSLALGKEVIDEDARASIENLLEMYVNDKEAFLRSVQTLTAEFKESKAQYSQEILLKASQLEALARKITSLTAKVQNNSAAIIHQETARVTADEAFAQELTLITADLNAANAAIIDEQTARVTADAALATDITTLSATVGTKNRTYYQSTAPVNNPPAIVLVSGDLWIDSDDNNKIYRYTGSSWSYVADQRIDVNTAAISTESTTRATADSALSSQITSVLAIANNNTAAINNEITARANGDSANATSISNVSARLDTGDFAAVKTESSATATKVGNIEAKWGVTTNVNGYVAGIQLLNGGSTSSSFTVDATKFVVKKPDGTNGIAWDGVNSRLDISGDVYANTFTSTGGVINTGDVATAAISNSASANVISYTPNLDLTITTAGGKTFVSGAFFVGGVTGPANALIQLYRGGTLRATFEAFVPDGASAANVSVAYSETPPTGSNTYTFVKNGTYMDGAAYVIELKR